MPENLSIDAASVTPLLLSWYASKGRDLPWRQTRDPFRIWLSEIMLQQTGVETVIPYYLKFLDRFPSVKALAAANLDAVIELWAGLGYYSRARNLHTTARKLVAEFDGNFPAEQSLLESLPGIGRSTAGAILAIAFEQKGVILDGNVRRVLCRLFALELDPRSAAAEKQLWRWADALTPADRPHDYAQAIMDLGAMLCLPRRPDCPACPLQSLCLAKTLGLQTELPRSRPKKALPQQLQVALLLQWQDRILVRKRGLEGMLGGLWEFPTGRVKPGQAATAAARQLLAELGVGGELQELGNIRHNYSHFKLELFSYLVRLEPPRQVAEPDESQQWLTLTELSSLPLHGAHKKIFARLAHPG